MAREGKARMVLEVVVIFAVLCLLGWAGFFSEDAADDLHSPKFHKSMYAKFRPQAVCVFTAPANAATVTTTVCANVSSGSSCVLTCLEGFTPTPVATLSCQDSGAFTVSTCNAVAAASSADFVVTLQRNCDGTYTQANFVNDVLAETGITVTVTNFQCGSIVVTYRCGAATTNDATSNCARVNTELSNGNSNLARRVATGRRDDGSNKGLWGLMALIALPFLLLCCILLIVKSRSHKDDLPPDDQPFHTPNETPNHTIYNGAYPNGMHPQPVMMHPVLVPQKQLVY